jgi:hypothetical protein
VEPYTTLYEAKADFFEGIRRARIFGVSTVTSILQRVFPGVFLKRFTGYSFSSKSFVYFP